MKLIDKTGVDQKKPGAALSSSDINKMNGTINILVETVNSLLKNTININEESGDYNRTYTLDSAIEFIKETNRRVIGTIIKFRGHYGFEEYIYSGPNVSDEEWGNINNWGLTIKTVDGGEY